MLDPNKSTALNEIPGDTSDDTEMTVGRVEAFSDGVFGVAITLLVLNLQVPHLAHGENTPASILAFLTAQGGTYFSYFISFLSIGSVWIGHHQAFKLIRRVDATLQLTNIIVLMAITLLPFTTAFLAEYISQPDASLLQVAMIAYSLHWIIMGVLMIVMWRYIRFGGLLKPNVSTARIKAVTNQFGVNGAVVGSIGLVVALFSPMLSLIFYMVTTLYFMLPLIGLLRPEKGSIAPR